MFTIAKTGGIRLLSFHMLIFLGCSFKATYASNQTASDPEWSSFSNLIFRKSENLPSKDKALLGSSCDLILYEQYSPIAIMARVDNSTSDTEKSKQVLGRAGVIKEFANAVTAGTAPSGAGATALYDLWKKNNGSEGDYPGKSLFKSICYSDGNEMLECILGICQCVSSGNFKDLKMAKMHQLHPVSEKELEVKGCFSYDCGLCYVNSKVCGQWGTCKTNEVVKDPEFAPKWPFKTLDGMCKDSFLNLNNQLGRKNKGFRLESIYYYILTFPLVCSIYFQFMNFY